VVNKSADGSAKTNSHTRNTLLLMDINFFGVKDQLSEGQVSILGIAVGVVKTG